MRSARRDTRDCSGESLQRAGGVVHIDSWRLPSLGFGDGLCGVFRCDDGYGRIGRKRCNCRRNNNGYRRCSNCRTRWTRQGADRRLPVSGAIHCDRIFFVEIDFRLRIGVLARRLRASRAIRTTTTATAATTATTTCTAFADYAFASRRRSIILRGRLDRGCGRSRDQRRIDDH